MPHFLSYRFNVMRIRLLLPFFGLLLFGAGCALSSADKDRQASELVGGQEVVFSPIEAKAAPTVVPVSVGVGSDTPIEPRVIKLTAGNFFFEPKTIMTKPGEKLSILFGKNDGEHDFVLDEANVKEEVTSGEAVEIIAPATPGHYAYYSDIGADRTLGMVGELIVE